MVDNLKQKLDALRAANGLRLSRPLDVSSYKASRKTSDGNLTQPLINFSSNDYLGLAGDQSLLENFFKDIDVTHKFNWMSASSARPLTGTSLTHEALENQIAKDYGKEKALLFNSGYHANSGILPAITVKDDLILADKLVHASIIDGLRLGSATFKRFAHNDMKHLEGLLERYSGQYTRIWVVTESVFSMDGDVAPLADLVELKKRYDAFLYVDEAHALGCLGENGLGLAEELGFIADVDVLVGVFGKALAGVGAFATADSILVEGMINFSRSWLFSTALPPINIEWSYYIWLQLKGFGDQRRQLHKLTTLFREELKEFDQLCLGESYIVPLLVPTNEAVVELSRNLEEEGFLALPIRSPTVKKGSERVRFSLTANIPEAALKDVISLLARVNLDSGSDLGLAPTLASTVSSEGK